MAIKNTIRTFLIGLFFMLHLWFRAEAQPREATSGHTLGIVIGVADYSNLDPLKYTDKDAMEFYLYLKESALSDSKNISILLNKNATYIKISQAFNNILRDAKKGDKVFVYFSGHGDNEQLSSNSFFLLLGDCPKKNYMASSAKLNKAFFEQYLQPLIERQVKIIFICDACHAGALIGGEVGRKNNNEALKNSWKNEVKLLSCQLNQSSLESTKWGGGRSVFSFYLILGMKGLADKNSDQKISISELQDYLDDNIVPAAKAFDLPQEPEVEGEKEFVISTTSPNLLGQAQRQFKYNSSSDAYNQLAGFKGAAIKIGDNIYIFKESSLGQHDDHLQIANEISITDNSWRAMYYSFKEKLEQGRLFTTEGASAYSYYKLLKENQPEAIEITDMKTSLLTALLNTYDTLTDHFYKDETSVFKNGLKFYDDKNLTTALELADDLPMIKDQIKARLLFLGACRQPSIDSNNANSIALVKEAIKMDSTNPAFYLKLGDLYYSNQQLTIAREYYKIYAQFLPNEERAHNRLGNVYLAIHQYDLANSEFEKVLQLNPSFYTAINNQKK